MDAKENTDYPTEEQMDELLTALEKDDPEEIKAVLRKRQQERGQPRDGGPDDHSANPEATSHVPEHALQINQTYPTRGQLANVLEAHKKGGEAGILAYLKKKRAERESGPKAEK